MTPADKAYVRPWYGRDAECKDYEVQVLDYLIRQKISRKLISEILGRSLKAIDKFITSRRKRETKDPGNPKFDPVKDARLVAACLAQGGLNEPANAGEG
jgi:hypothetical protein